MSVATIIRDLVKSSPSVGRPCSRVPGRGPGLRLPVVTPSTPELEFTPVHRPYQDSARRFSDNRPTRRVVRARPASRVCSRSKPDACGRGHEPAFCNSCMGPASEGCVTGTSRAASQVPLSYSSKVKTVFTSSKLSLKPENVILSGVSVTGSNTRTPDDNAPGEMLLEGSL